MKILRSVAQHFPRAVSWLPRWFLVTGKIRAEQEDKNNLETLTSKLDKIVFSKKEAPSFSKAKEEIKNQPPHAKFKFGGEETLKDQGEIPFWRKENNIVIIYSYPKSSDGSTKSIVFYGEDKENQTENPDVRRLEFDEPGKLLRTTDIVKRRTLEREFDPSGNIACARIRFGHGQALECNYTTEEGWVFTSEFGQNKSPLTRHGDLTLKQCIDVFGPVKVRSSDPELNAVLEHPWERPKPQNEIETMLDEMMYKIPPTLSEILAQIRAALKQSKLEMAGLSFKKVDALERRQGMPAQDVSNTIILFGKDKIGFYDSEGQLRRRLEFDSNGRMDTDWRSHTEGDKEYIYYTTYCDQSDVYRVNVARLVLVTKGAKPDGTTRDEYIESTPGEVWTYKRSEWGNRGNPLQEREFEMAKKFVDIFSGEIRG